MPRRFPALRLALVCFLLLMAAPACQKAALSSRESAPGGVAMEYPAAAQVELAINGKQKEKAEGGEGAKTWKRSEVVPNTSRLMVGDDRELEIRGMQTRVRVDGFRARVLIDYYFFNPDGQQYEGNFTVRLPPGATPYFLAFGQGAVEAQLDAAPWAESHDLAFDPDDVMLERAARWVEPKKARIVPREQAAFAFGDTVRRAVDPALMEWAGPGMFRARLFPIAPQKVHRVVVGYDTDLTAIASDYELVVPVPKGVGSTQLHVAVAKSEGVETLVTPAGSPDDSPTTQYFTFTNPTEESITIRRKGLVSAELRGADALGPYFAAQFVPDLPEVKGGSARPDALFLVDRSMSSNPDRFNIWLQLLAAVLENNRPDVARFAVVFFNIESFAWRPGWIENTPENVAALRDYANGLALEGATDIGQALDYVANAKLLEGSDADLFLLSDGAVTWGDGDRYALSKRVPTRVFAYRTGMTGDDVGMLEHFARESGGAVFSVVGESEIPAAARAHTLPPWTIRSIAVEGGSDLLLAGRPKTIFPGQRLTLVGRGAPNGAYRLDLQNGEARNTFEVRVDTRFDSPLAARTYGQVAVGQLEEFVAATRPVAEAYARHFLVPGESSSLLMLDTEEDYQRYGIVPKDDEALVQAKWASHSVAAAIDELFQALGDPKAAFEAWMKRATEIPGVMLQPSKELDYVVGALPREAFAVPQARVSAERHDHKAVGAQLRELLARQKPDYDVVAADAERRRRETGAAAALVSLSSLVEANPGDGVLARDVGYSAAAWGLPLQAYHLFRRVATSRPWEPQTYHAMANALASAGKPDLAMLYYEIALSGQWDSRFGSFRQIVEFDYLRFLSGAGAGKIDPVARAFATKRKAELLRSTGIDAADIVVVISWNTDNTDVDLHVLEPSGEECYYENRETRIGGRLTQDVTNGYGPEMYVLRKARKGRYDVKVKYFASDANRAGTRTKVNARVYRNWGRPSEEVTTKVVTLESRDELQPILSFER